MTTYVTVAEVRAMPGMADGAKFPDADIVNAIEWFESKFEEYSGVAWAPRSASDWVDGTGSRWLGLPRFPVISLQSVKVYSDATTFVAYSAAELADIRISVTGYLLRVGLGYWPWGRQNILVDYTFGYSPTPLWVKDAALMAIADKLRSDLTNSRARTQYATETGEGIIRTSMPGPDRPFGIPAVDEAANRARRYREVAIA